MEGLEVAVRVVESTNTITRGNNATSEIWVSRRHNRSEVSCPAFSDRVADYSVRAEGARCSQLFTADGATVRKLPLCTARAECIRKTIQIGRVHVYNQAGGFR